MALATTDRPLHEIHDVALLDLDGVVYVGPDAVPHAREALEAAAGRGMGIAYLTNNASRRPEDVADHLRDLGMPVSGTEAVVTSAQAVARLIVDDIGPGEKVLVAGGVGLRHCLEEVGLVPVARLGDGVRAVVQGFSPDLTWADLAEASYAVHAGLPWYASNTDLTFPSARGTAPGNGSMVQAVANATGRAPRVAGKPERALFEETLARLRPGSPLMVGDRIDTDIDGAAAAGIDSLAVLTGVSSLQTVAATTAASRPTYVAPDLRGLLVDHPPVEIGRGDARCADAQVRHLDGSLEWDGSGEALHAVRAAIGLAWEIIDRGDTVPAVDHLLAVS
ncbi:HAD hydrolase-like protein [Aeromicrobium halocynthiae]|uniref:HAD hydrolase-like protein n=1 Tax=Aeromicrobium halocynthiae TaxID=560557 RepID=A0ABP5HA35_9ACTN